MATIATYNFPKAYRGDTYKPIRFTISNNGLPVDLTGAFIRIWFYGSSAVPALKLSTIDGSVLVVNAADGVFETAQFIMNLPKGLYTHDCEISYPYGYVKTYFKGSLEVEPDLTK